MEVSNPRDVTSEVVQPHKLSQPIIGNNLKTDMTSQRIMQLEEENATLRSENNILRQRIRDLENETNKIKSGPSIDLFA